LHLSVIDICNFNNLKVKGVLLDEIMKNPTRPDKELLIKFETKSLRDTRGRIWWLANWANSIDLLATVGLGDSFIFAEGNPHPRYG
jgi:WD repeat-containing protein 35